MLSERDKDLIAVDRAQVDVRMGLVMWDYVLGQLAQDDETTKTIRKACKDRLIDLLPHTTIEWD